MFKVEHLIKLKLSALHMWYIQTLWAATRERCATDQSLDGDLKAARAKDKARAKASEEFKR